MAISKERRNLLMVWADDVIRNSTIYSQTKKEIISDSYNGQIAAFSVSVALSGLKPAMALYFSGKGSSDVDKKKIIDLLAKMYGKETKSPLNADAFFKLVIDATGNELADLQKKIIEYGIALKLAVRTFKFKSHG
jgi:hypothetical protein